MTPEHRKLIDHTLATVATELAGRLRDLTPQLLPGVARLSLDDLRASALGRNLALLAEVVDGEPSVPKSRIAAAIEAVEVALFVPLAPPAEGGWRPRPTAAVHDTPMGRLLKAARIRALDVSTAVFVSDTTRRLGLPKGYVTRLIQLGELHTVDVGGRKMLSHEEYQRLVARWRRDGGGAPSEPATAASAPEALPG
jgi:hypothetical protein